MLKSAALGWYQPTGRFLLRCVMIYQLRLPITLGVDGLFLKLVKGLGAVVFMLLAVEVVLHLI